LLEKLVIKNYLIIKQAELDFTKGLNILSGETGAGKTIILDALALILGERADYSIIKNDSEKLIIEGQFNFNKNKSVENFLKEKDLFLNDDKESIVIIRRELTKKGISRNFINDTPVNISDLKDFGDLIIDIHSQNEHQSLLKKDTHIDFLDNYLKNKNIFFDYQEKFYILKEIISSYENLIKNKNELMERKSFLEYQLKEINNTNPAPNEDEELENNLKKLENSEEISTSLQNCLNLLYEGENNILASLSNSNKELKKISKYDNNILKLIEIFEQNYISIKTGIEELRDYSGGVNFDPLLIEQIRTRLATLTHLKKKYRLTISELIDKSEEIKKELDLTENFDFEIEKLEKEIQNQKKITFEIAQKISKERKSASKELEKKVNSYLQEVGLESAEFKVDFEFTGKGDDKYSFEEKNQIYNFTHNGVDSVEFLIKANKGSEFSQLRKTASGGEISRIMLSLKASMSGKDKVPILVFDEIDAGISGKVAGKVGKLLSELSKSHQIISITHLPQIAAMSDNHFYVNKKDLTKETVAEIKTLTKEEKILEVARLLSGEKITDLSKKNAEELISQKR